MTDDAIIKKVIKGLGEVGLETGKEAVGEAGKITESIITGTELLGNIKPLTEAELAQKKAEDEKKITEEGTAVAKAMANQGRNVGEEIKQVRAEKSQEEQKEEQFLKQIQQQREAEEAERQQMTEVPGNSKREAAKTQFAPGKRKKQQPDLAQMSQTSEFKGGKID